MKRRSLALGLAVIALAGCAAAPTAKTRFYVLSVDGPPALQGTAAAANAPGAAISVSVARAAVPGVVDRPQIVARVAANKVEILDFDRWAEPLPEAIPRVIAGNLARELGPRYGVAAGVIPGAPPAVRVALDVQRFEAVMGSAVTVDAVWSVRAAAGAARTGRSVIEERAAEGGAAGIAAAYSRALAAVARDIAAAVSVTQP